MIPPTTTPTPSELLSLTALVPFRKTRPLSTRAHLAHLLSALHPPEVLRYLFAPEPVHLPLLLSPNLRDHALTFQHTTTRVEPPPPLLPSPTFTATSSHHITSTLLLAPALTLPPLTTLGVGVMRGVEALGELILPLSQVRATSHCLNFRFLHDPLHPVILLVYDAPDDDQIVIYLCSNMSLTVLHSFTAAFDRPSLLAAVRDPDSLSVDDLERSLLYLFQDMNARSCPFCGGAAGAPCKCLVPVSQPKHSLDFSHFRKNFFAYFGAYQGVATKIVAKGPAASKEFVFLGARAAMKSVLDPSIVDRFRDWAVSRHVQDVTLSPLESVALISPPAIKFEQYEDEDAYSTDWLTTDDHQHRISQPYDTPARRSSIASTHLAELLADVGDDDVGDHTPVSTTSSRQQQEDEAWIPFLAQPPSTFESGPLGIEETVVHHRYPPALRLDTSTIDTESENRQDAFWRDSQSGLKRSRASPVTASPSPVFCSPPQPDVAEINRESVILGLADSVPVPKRPAIEDERPARKRLAPGGTEDVHEILRRMKDEERKERNRVSARRSNRKKKERGEALESALKSTQKLAADLRAKELRLREENTLLRGAFQGSE